MIRQIIEIDEIKCNGCGQCARACHEGAIELVNGKAKLVRDDYCDGLGDCLPSCPQGAITFVEREAAAYNEAAVQANLSQKEQTSKCDAPDGRNAEGAQPMCDSDPQAPFCPSRLQNWPVQIKLAPTQAPYFQGADLLIAADCCAYAYGNFHADYIQGTRCLIGCPKLDSIDYSEKLAAIIALNDIRSITLTRMEVPCCGGLERMVKAALNAAAKDVPLRVVTFSIGGRILN